MNQVTISTSTGVQEFLSAVSDFCIPHIRSARDFLEAFPPALIMERVEDAVVRGDILHATVGTRVEIGRKTSRRSAAEHLKIALDEGLVEPEVVLTFLNPDHRVLYLDGSSLWSFAVETKFWEGDDADTVRIANARNMFALMLEIALKQALVTSEEVIRAIGFMKILESEPKTGLIQTIEALALSGTENKFKLLIERYTPKKIVSVVDLGLIWQNVIHPLIAVRHGLATQTVEQHDSPPPIADTHAPPVSTLEYPESRPTNSSPVSSTQPFSKSALSSLSSLGSPLHAPIAGARASSVPAASRGSGVSAPPSKEDESKNPKGDEASVTTVSDVDDDDGVEVDDDELVDGDRVSNEPPQADVAQPETLAIVSTDSLSSPASTSEAGQINAAPVEEVPSPPIARSPSSTFPAVRQPPRPSRSSEPDVRVVLRGRVEVDADELEAIEAEERARAFRTTEGSEVAHIPDDAFAQAGGMTKSDPHPREEEASITSVEGKTAVCMLLRSKDVGLKLGEVDMFSCQIHHVLTTALAEIDPVEYREAQTRYGETDKQDLGNILCIEVEKRNPVAAIKLRALLVEINCATKPEPLSYRPGKPPPLPPQPKSVQSGRGGKGR